jgi:hypothetical protein
MYLNTLEDEEEKKTKWGDIVRAREIEKRE